MISATRYNRYGPMSCEFCENGSMMPNREQEIENNNKHEENEG